MQEIEHVQQKSIFAFVVVGILDCRPLRDVHRGICRNHSRKKRFQNDRIRQREKSYLHNHSENLSEWATDQQKYYSHDCQKKVGRNRRTKADCIPGSSLPIRHFIGPALCLRCPDECRTVGELPETMNDAGPGKTRG
ncbi:MAG TPA: hypothetical protein PKC23_00055 [Candidatus Desulfobacillus sp.]|nr:hypothetical protein [Candidatus Desulfobacillus sp.]